MIAQSSAVPFEMNDTCTYCELGTEPGCDACRAVEPEGEPAVHVVYRIRHLPTGRLYVGVHKLPPEHLSPFIDDGYQGSSEYLDRAIDKHGWGEFRKDVLAVCPNSASAYELEGGLVGPEQAASPMYFNLAGGGLGGIAHLSEEAEARRLERHREATQTEEWRATQRAAQLRPGTRARKSAAASSSNRQRYKDPAARRQTGVASQRAWDGCTPEERDARIEKAAEGVRESRKRPEVRANLSAGVKAKYDSDPAYKARVAKSNRVKAKSYWAAMSPEERSAEMKRRHAARRKNGEQAA